MQGSEGVMEGRGGVGSGVPARLRVLTNYGTSVSQLE